MNAESILERLLPFFYVADGDVVWGLVEDHPISREDPELNEALRKMLTTENERTRDTEK